MRIWMHKKTGELAVARNVWLEMDLELAPSGYTLQTVSTATLGWAFENKYGVCMILPHDIQSEFEDLGEL